MWKCLCDCGTIKIIKGRNLKIGKTKSCGCLSTGPKSTTPIGKKYNRLTIFKKIGRSKCRQQIVECECDCGNKINTLLSRVKKGICKSCGCLKKENDNNRKGENNPRYNPELDDDHRIRRRISDEYKKWRREVKEKYKYVCVVCDETKSSHMIAHHLDGYHWCIEKRTDINNGVCLCEGCHNNFHIKYGKGNNTKKQFLEFLNDIKNESVSNN